MLTRIVFRSGHECDFSDGETPIGPTSLGIPSILPRVRENMRDRVF